MKLRTRHGFNLGLATVDVLDESGRKVGELTQKTNGYGAAFKGRVTGYAFAPAAGSGLSPTSAGTLRDALRAAVQA